MNECPRCGHGYSASVIVPVCANCGYRVRPLLTVTIPGAVVSGNHSKFRSNRLTPESREFDARVRSILIAEVRRVGWVAPEYVEVEITLWNSLVDWDNAAKEIMDPLQGLAISLDSRVLDARVTKRLDAGRPRIVVTIQQADPALYGYTPAMRKARTKAIKRGEIEPLRARRVRRDRPAR